MAIFTTAATAPLLYLVWQRHPESKGGDSAIDESTPLNTTRSESAV